MVSRQPNGRLLGRIGRNLSYLLGGKAAAGLISLGYIAIATRALGPAGFGTLTLMYGFAMMVGAVVRVQPGRALVHFGARALAEHRPDRLVPMVRQLAAVELAVAAAAAVIASLASSWVGPRLGWTAEAQRFAPLVALAVIATMRSTPSGLLQLFGRFDLIAGQTTVEPLVRLAGACSAFALSLGLRGFVIAWVAAVWVEWTVMWAMGWTIARRALGPAWRRRGEPIVERGRLWRFVAATNVDVAVTELAGRLPALTVGWVLGPAAAGLYGVAIRVTSVLAQPAQVLGAPPMRSSHGMSRLAMTRGGYAGVS